MKLSIIIPHKNSPVLLERLLQSLEEIQHLAHIIVVDDHSDANSLILLNKLQSVYKFELFTNDGKGAGAARNTGLHRVDSEWVMFADADDFFIQPFVNDILYYLSSDYDIVFFNVSSCYSETLENAYRDGHIKYIVEKYQKKNDENYLRCGYTPPWGKLYKYSLIKKHQIEFEEILSGNDMMFSIQCGIQAQNICYNPREIYMVTVSSGSLTTTLNQTSFESRFQATIRCNNYLRQHKKSRYQLSVLYFIAKSSQFGLKYMLHVLNVCIKNRSNLFIGLYKLFNVRKVLQDRQNSNYIVSTSK